MKQKWRLEFCKKRRDEGTTGLKLGYRKAKATAAENALAKAVGADAVPGIASGVGNAEYRDILGGTGAHSTQAGMLIEMKHLFASLGRSWIWQQDGARAHTLSKTTPNGKATRALILAHADELLDDWPALSAVVVGSLKILSAVTLSPNPYDRTLGQGCASALRASAHVGGFFRRAPTAPRASVRPFSRRPRPARILPASYGVQLVYSRSC